MIPARILVTGAGGFVGPHVRAACAGQFPEAEIFAGEADVTDGEAVREMIAEAKPDAVIHLAGIASVTAARAAPERAFAVNLGGTLNLARVLLDHAPAALLVNAGGVECYDASFCAGVALDEMAAESGLRVVRLRPVDILTALGDAGSAARLLGWQPEVTFETTLREVLAVSWNLARQIRK